VTIRRWVEANGRLASPKYIVGESYGGFRAPKIARLLQTDQGVGVDGLVLVSPVLDFRRFDQGESIFQHVARLPSYAATARERRGPVTRADMRDVEEYAAGEYLVDLVKGVNDKAAVARVTRRVAELTGLDAALVERLGGRIPVDVFAREINRAEGRISSGYDANVTSFDPFPQAPRSGGDDQMRLGLHAPIISAMVELYRNKLNWTVENGRYVFINEQAGRQWEGRREAESLSDLRRVLALDPRVRVLATHGLTDIVTAYFETKMVLDQTPDFGGEKRVRLAVYPGGHMSYSREASRKAMRDDARALMERKAR
jgi:carboxypeptidase C (cathepsin A)